MQLLNKNLLRFFVYSPIVGLSLFIGCASTPIRGRAEDSALDSSRLRADSSSEGREYQTIDSDYRQRNYESVLKRTKVFIKSYPQSEYADGAQHLRGLSFLGLKQYKNAQIALAKAIEITKNSNIKNIATYNLAYAHFETNEIAKAAELLETIRPSNLERNERIKYFVLNAKVARMRQDNINAARSTLQAIRESSERVSISQDDPLVAFFDESIEPISNISALEKLLGEYEGSVVADRLIYRVANSYFGAGDREKAKNLFEKIVKQYTGSRYLVSARDALRKLDYHGAVDPKRVGVVLTLSGKFSKFGYRSLQGIELATKIFSSQPGTDPITLVVMDDQGEIDRALVVMEDLVYKHHVTSIIGPLVSKLAEPMGKKAQELGVPLIALTQKEATGGDFVFNAALTLAMQVHQLIRYATEKAGIKNFAMLAPNSKFGEEYSKAFWDELEQTRGSIQGYETYPNEETDFRLYIDRLVGLGYPEARGKELEELRLLKAATPVKTRSKKFDRMFELKPYVDFEAVFIPDEPKTLGQILPTFAYRDVDKILFLGINTWNSQELLARAGQFAEGSVFVDGFYSGSENADTKHFIEEYRQTFGTEPTVLEALAYDAAHIVSSVVKRGDAQSRAQVRDRIMALRDFPGVSGKISYQNGRLTKKLNLLTIRGGKIEEIALK